MGSSEEAESTKIELKTERLEKYTEDIDQLVSMTRKSEREKMEAVMRGLPHDIQRQVMYHKPKSVEAVRVCEAPETE